MKDNTSASKNPTRKKDGNNAIKNREEFIKSIEKFIDYLVVAWDDLQGFQFENKSLRRNRISNDKVSVYTSLNDAFLDYQWNNHGFIETTKGLIVFRKRIRSSEVINDRYKLYITINEILRWGGVLKDDIAGRFLDMVLTGDLVMYIQWARDSFSANSNNLSVLSEAPPPSKLASDSGATKVYTMLCDGCVIYDDRVAASLCLLISKYLGENNLLPAPLKLMSGKRGSKKKNLEDTQGTNRDPSTKNHRFIKKTTGEEHAYSNLKANWIILTMAKKLMRSNDRFSALVNQSCEKMYNKNINHDDKTWVAMRIIETSLFMAGHSVPLFPIK